MSLNLWENLRFTRDHFYEFIITSCLSFIVTHTNVVVPSFATSWIESLRAGPGSHIEENSSDYKVFIYNLLLLLTAKMQYDVAFKWREAKVEARCAHTNN